MLKKIIRNCIPKNIYEKIYDIKYAIKIRYFYSYIYQKYEKKTKNRKIRIVFIVQRTEVFSSVASIFNEAKKNKDIDEYLFALPPNRKNGRSLDLNSTKVIDFCKKITNKVINSYDDQTNTYYDLEKLNPDYIFLNVPYTTHYPEKYNMEYLSSIAKVCYVPYGFNLFANKNHYNLLFQDALLKNVYFLFAEGDATYYYLKGKLSFSQWHRNQRLYNIGFPRFDMYEKLNVEKINNKSIKNILYIPRWTSIHRNIKKGNIGSSFFEVKDKIIEYSEKNKDIDIVIRPHPLAFSNYIQSGEMSKIEVDEYENKIEKRNNIFLDKNNTYINSLLNADVLIADFSSIIIEFFITGKPIIYFGSKNEISSLYSYIYDTFYIVNSWEDIERVLTELKKGNDYLKEKRKKSIQVFNKSQGKNTGKKIIDVLMNDYYKINTK